MCIVSHLISSHVLSGSSLDQVAIWLNSWDYTWPCKIDMQGQKEIPSTQKLS